MLSFATLLLAPLALAAITPTSPDSTTVVKEGDQLTTMWATDSTGLWTDMEIQLMTGDNYKMIPLQVLASGIDGTSTTSYTFTVPKVTPNSQIYFLQFTKGGDVTTATWVTRFTIAGEDGSTTEPTNSTVYSGQSVNWGTGALADGTNSTSGAGNVSPSNTTNTNPSGAATVVSLPSASTSPSAQSAAVAVSPTSASSSKSMSSSTSASSSAAVTAVRAAASTGAAIKGASVGVGAVLMGLLSLVLVEGSYVSTTVMSGMAVM